MSKLYAAICALGLMMSATLPTTIQARAFNEDPVPEEVKCSRTERLLGECGEPRPNCEWDCGPSEPRCELFEDCGPKPREPKACELNDSCVPRCERLDWLDEDVVCRP